MKRRGKLKNKVEQNKHHVSFSDLKQLLEMYGFTVNNLSGGSHYTVKHSISGIIDIMEPHTIVWHKPHVKIGYVVNALKWIRKVENHEKEN